MDQFININIRVNLWIFYLFFFSNKVVYSLSNWVFFYFFMFFLSICYDSFCHQFIVMDNYVIDDWLFYKALC